MFVALQDCRSVVQSNVRLLIFNTIRSAIGIIGLLSSVHQSVRPSVTLCIVEIMVGVGVESCSIVFL